MRIGTILLIGAGGYVAWKAWEASRAGGIDPLDANVVRECRLAIINPGGDPLAHQDAQPGWYYWAPEAPWPPPMGVRLGDGAWRGPWPSSAAATDACRRGLE